MAAGPTTSVVLSAVNNSPAVSRGYCEPNFTMRVKDLTTKGKAINVESAQFELHFENVTTESNKLYVLTAQTGEETGQQTTETSVSILTGTYTEVNHLVKVINQTLENAGHSDIVFTYVREQSRLQIRVAAGKTLRLKRDSPSLIFGIGEISEDMSWDAAGGSSGIVKTLPYAVDLSAGRRAVLLYTDLINPAVEYEDNSDSRVLKTFLIQTLDGINNYMLAKPDFRLMVPYNQVNEISFWLRYNTGEYITKGYPIFLDLRIIDLN